MNDDALVFDFDDAQALAIQGFLVKGIWFSSFVDILDILIVTYFVVVVSLLFMS